MDYSAMTPTQGPMRSEDFKQASIAIETNSSYDAGRKELELKWLAEDQRIAASVAYRKDFKN